MTRRISARLREEAAVMRATSIGVRVCRRCGGFQAAAAEYSRPPNTAVEGRDFVALFLPTSRDLNAYYGGCKCDEERPAP